MPLLLADHTTPAEAAAAQEAELAAFRQQWRYVRRQGKLLAGQAEMVCDNNGTDDYAETERIYLLHYARVWREVQALIGLAVKLSPGARAHVEAGIGCPLFGGKGELTEWWRNLWLGPEVQAASLVRRKNDKSRV